MGNCVSRKDSDTAASAGVSADTAVPPGLPSQDPTVSFWTVPAAPIADYQSQTTLPSHADIVIIGSGITGTSFARTVLSHGEPVHVVMLEARETCSGATGRNGGHINPPLYHDYTALKRQFGAETAKAIMRFRLSHLGEMRRVAAEEQLVEASQCREVESVDVYYDQGVFDKAKRKLEAYRRDMPVESAPYRVYEAAEAREKFHLSPFVAGCMTSIAGAVHPYRLITGILTRLLIEHPKSFELYTHTPCTSIAEPSASEPFYTLTTPRGRITARHVVHATNGYAASLLPSFTRAIVPVCETMSAQRPGMSVHQTTRSGARSFVFYSRRPGFDYLTQLPGTTGENELMFGAGFDDGVNTGGDGTGLGETNDGVYDVHNAVHVSGALPVYFGERNWGEESVPAGVGDEGEGWRWNRGRVKAMWSGILSLSGDGLPWVGRLPRSVTGRKGVVRGRNWDEKRGEKAPRDVASGEWIAAGYSGEGMVHAWMSAKALAYMVLGEEDGFKAWFPDVFRVTEDRWERCTRTKVDFGCNAITRVASYWRSCRQSCGWSGKLKID
ncbi:FAD dependent oxidoreductase-domain-containing protein [Hygrophoropsis aurantiaca]|uniref:FAD dependent oxidoreductase-domain-containing protein n=1 Tax=Hygrophoropsis aurantiaca TaxID=72124 RepID=A0ACB8A963_9AGAM|nr:FAD dependent oxidoreductase-domain-containing protein [Hygrophoropsis aurantiaca]